MRIRRNPLIFFMLAAVSLVATAEAAGLGAKYGTRDPLQCASTSAPGSGPPSAEQAARYLQCTVEQESGQALTLLQDVVVAVAAKGRPYNPQRDHLNEIDVDQPIYAIRGSFVRFSCVRPDADILQNVGKNCSSVEQPNASGLCWKTTFGDWRCTMNDLNVYRMTPGQAPPR